MAKSSDGGNRPPPDLLLTDISGEGPEPKTESATSPGKLPENELEPDAPSKRGDELSSGVECPAGAGASAEEKSGELRGTEDETPQEPKQSHDDLSERLEKIETAVGELPALREDVREVAEQSKLVRSAFVGVSDRFEGLERRLSETLKVVEGTAATVGETAAELKRKDRNLKLAERLIDERLDKALQFEKDIRTIKRIAIGWSVVIGVVVVVFVRSVLERSGLL